MGLSVEHETLILLFKNQPSLALELLRRAGVFRDKVPRRAQIESADLTQAVPAEYRADLVIRHRGRKPLVVIVEVQRARKAAKRYTWPVYTVLLRARFRCQVHLVVFAPDAAIARWARKPIPLGNSAVFVPTVFSPADVPAVTDHAVARAEPELAILSAVAHGRARDVSRSVAITRASYAALEVLPDELGMLYFDLVRTYLSEAARKVIDAMIPVGYKFKSDFARKYVARGLAEGEAKAVITVLKARGIRLTEEQRARIQDCRDLKRLNRWVRRAGTVRSARELFANGRGRAAR